MKPRLAPIPPILRRGLAIVAILAIMVGGVTLTATDNPLPTVFTMPGATAEPTGPPGPPGPGPGSGSGGSQFQPPDMGGIDGGYSGGNYPAPPQGDGIDINNPTAAPGYDQAPQYPQQQQPYPSRQPPVHGTQPPDYDLPPQQQQQPPQQTQPSTPTTVSTRPSTPTTVSTQPSTPTTVSSARPTSMVPSSHTSRPREETPRTPAERRRPAQIANPPC